MVNISGALSAGQIGSYYEQSYAAGASEYYSEGETIRGQWQGQLAEEFGLRGDVDAADLQRLADGQSPDGVQLIRVGDNHRAGWDATFSAPKSISLVALVGADDRLREAHREAVKAGVETFERYTQAHVSANVNETTGRLAAAVFEHDSARPVDGYSAPQLHSHVVIQNITRTADGRFRSLADRELFRTQQLATAVYRSELAHRVEALGYEVVVDAHGAPQIAGISAEYIQASSPRRQQIEAAMQAAGVRGADAAQIAAHQTRDAKTYDRAAMLAQHQAVSAQFGHEAERAVAQAIEISRRREISVDAASTKIDHRLSAVDAVGFAVEKNLERSSTVDERRLLADSLTNQLGAVRVDDVRAELAQRVDDGWLLERERGQKPARVFTSPELVRLERETIAAMQVGRGQSPALGDLGGRSVHRDQLSSDQRAVVAQVLANTDRVQALDGRAGVGKTTTLAAVRVGAEANGYQVVGLAPHSRAVQELARTGIQAQTLQSHVQQAANTVPGGNRNLPRLYVLDESSLASTRQMHRFLSTLGPSDRVLLVGDTRQHESVEAGRPFGQLQDAGMATARLETIVRQQVPEYRAAVEQLSAGQTREALQKFPVVEIRDRVLRHRAVAEAYLQDPKHTIVVAPDNRSREALNSVIRDALVQRGDVQAGAHRVTVLVPRQELTTADLQRARSYHVGDVVRSRDGAATVVAVDALTNQVTTRGADGRTVTANPAQWSGVSVSAPQEREFSRGDKVQFTQPDAALGVATRQVGTIAAVNDDAMRVTVNGRSVGFTFNEYRYLDSGYVVTSHASQGSTAQHVILHIDSDHARAALSQRTAYVGLSRGSQSATIFTNNAEAMTAALSRDVSHTQALEVSQAPAIGRGHDHGFSL